MDDGEMWLQLEELPCADAGGQAAPLFVVLQFPAFIAKGQR